MYLPVSTASGPPSASRPSRRSRACVYSIDVDGFQRTRPCGSRPCSERSTPSCCLVVIAIGRHPTQRAIRAAALDVETMVKRPLLLLVLVAALAGCGSDDEASDSTTAAGNSGTIDFDRHRVRLEPENATVDAAGEVTIHVVNNGAEDPRARGRERRPRRRRGDRRDRSGRVCRPDRRPARRRVRDLLPDRRSQIEGHGDNTRGRVGRRRRHRHRRDGHGRGQRLRGVVRLAA